MGDLSPLGEQIGSATGLNELGSVAAAISLCPNETQASIKQFIDRYREEVLFSIELPAICQAYLHASRSEVRELIEVDLQLSQEPSLESFSRPGQEIGRAQLQQLRPLRDQRLVQRYLAAVERGESPCWHTVVYGVILWHYSLPLRQGLLHYAQQTLNGFLQSAGNSADIPDNVQRQFWQETSAALPSLVDRVLTQNEQIGRLQG